MERKIGETFEFEGKTLQVKEIAEHTCEGCFFTKLCNEKISIGVTGNCFDRTDKKDVVFVEVQEQPHEEDEQPQKLNLCEVLKYCPEGMEFWSPIIGAVSFSRIDDGRVFFKSAYGTEWDFNPDSTITFRFDERNKQTSPEPMIFPSREQRDWSKVRFESPLEKLPKSWAEFCNTHEVQKGEAYIKDISTIYEAEKSGDTRDTYADMNILPSKQACIQHLALMQLHQLRDCWRDGWKPEPNKTRWAITNDSRGCLEVNSFEDVGVFLSFQDMERTELFLQHFRILIERAGDLI